MTAISTLAQLDARIQQATEMEILLRRLRHHIDVEVEDDDGPFWLAEIDFVLRESDAPSR